MPFSGVADSEQLKMLTDILDGYCQERDISSSSIERDDAGRLLMWLFGNGVVCPEALANSLGAADFRGGDTMAA